MEEGGKKRKHISGRGDMQAKTEKRRRIIFATLLPAPYRRITCDAGRERGITRRLEREERGREASR